MTVDQGEVGPGGNNDLWLPYDLCAARPHFPLTHITGHPEWEEIFNIHHAGMTSDQDHTYPLSSNIY